MEETRDRLPQDLLQRLAANGEVQRFARGRVLFHEGDASNSMYVLIKGQLKVYCRSDNGREVVYNILEPGEFLGEILLDGGPRSASVRATADSECLVVDSAEIRRLMRSHPEFTEYIALTLATRLRQASRKIRSLALDSVYERIAVLLEETALSDGKVKHVPRSLTQIEIANQVGATREMVNHALRDLIRGGYILKDKQHRMTIVQKLPKRR